MPLDILVIRCKLPGSIDEKIRDRIRSEGIITFAEFMEMALYDSDDGYYSNVSNLNVIRDYYTSPSVHPVFGALLSVLFQQMWEALERPERFIVVEIGAGSGLLAEDTAKYISVLNPDFQNSFSYIAIDRYSPPKQSEIEWIVSDRLPMRNVVGCIVSNELLDSFPVRRFTVQNRLLKELFVDLDNEGHFCEVPLDPSETLNDTNIPQIIQGLPDGFCGEVNLNIDVWIDGLIKALKRGFVLTIDYGYQSHELYSLKRSLGTLQTYYYHTQGNNPYERIGKQDITAHVNFTDVIELGELKGLKPIGFESQAEFLKKLGLTRIIRQLGRKTLGIQEENANRVGMLELLKLEGLGGFKVLIQETNTDVESLDDLLPSEKQVCFPEVPLLGPGRLRLMESRYPHLGWEPPSF